MPREVVVSRVPLIAAVVLMSLSFVVPVARAQCMQCDPALRCSRGVGGARFCFEGPGSCTLFMPCLGGGSRDQDPIAEGELTALTLFESDPAGRRARSGRHLASDVLRLGDEARVGVAAGAVADLGIAHGREFTGTFVDDAGEGFAIERLPEGGRVRLRVREVAGGVSGAVLADESLDDRERLVVPVRLEGRVRTLVLQAARLPGTGAVEVRRMRRVINEAGRALGGRDRPLLRPRDH